MLFIASGQSNYAQQDKDYYHLIDRYQLLNDSGFTSLHTSFKPYRQTDIVASMHLTDSSQVDVFNVTYIEGENRFYVNDSVYSSQKPFLNHLYKYKNDAFYVSEPDFKLSINPILYLGGGVEKDNADKLYVNSRGIEVDALIDQKVGFYASVIENQASFPSYAAARTYGYGAVPGENFWKQFKVSGVDFFSAKGYVTFNATKHIDVQFGYDKNFVGNGYRSLILSNNSGNYTFLKLRTKIWKFQYTNLFAEMTGDYATTGANTPRDGFNAKKFLALHHLSLNVTKRFNIGFFESVVYGNNSFDVNYMNPVIFYRAVEGNLGSNGNVLLGTEFNWNLAKGFSLYGQVVLDEFLLNEIKSGANWWANKYALQGGMKYINVAGVKNLDLQGEINIVRPYTYSHKEKATSYSHYNQALAHPLGANFEEMIGILKYQPFKKVSITSKLMLVKAGLDSLNGAISYGSVGSSNWGGNVLLPNTTREQDYGNTQGQGVGTTIAYLDLIISYQLKHGLFLDVSSGVRKQSFDIKLTAESATFTQFSLRWNIP